MGPAGKHVKMKQPFVAYSAQQQIFVRGEMDLTSATKALEPEGLFPVLTASGLAATTIICNKLHKSVVPNPYWEIMLCIDAVPRKQEKSVLPSSSWAHTHDIFGSIPGERLFLHTLYVEDSFACDASRQTQAFPKHPDLCQVAFSDSNGVIDITATTADTKELLVSIHIEKAWPSCCGMCGLQEKGCCMLNRMACGLIQGFGICNVLGLLASSNVQFPIRMPLACAQHEKVSPDYAVILHKGLNPLGTQVWPASPSEEDGAATATVEFGSLTLPPTGVEENNGHLLFREGGFQPRLVVHLPDSGFAVHNSEPLNDHVPQSAKEVERS